MALVFAATLFYRVSKRKREISALEDACRPTAFPSGFAHAATIQKRPLNVPKLPPPLDRPPRHAYFSSKRPLLSPSTGVEESESSTHPPSVAPAPHNPSRTSRSPVTTPDTVLMGTDDDTEEGDQLVRDRARTEFDGGRGNVVGTQYVRHTDAGVVVSPELPPSYEI
jgi:hypothetical protein